MPHHEICCLTALLVCAAWAGQPWALGGAAPAKGILSPTAGETWATASRHYVLWQTDIFPADGAVRIEYTADAGKNWTEIAAGAPNSGKLLWQVPDAASKQCMMRVSGGSPATSAQSAESFSIIPSQEVPDYKWMNVTNSAAYAPRDGAGALVFKGRLWLLGGWNPGDKKNFPRICNNEVWSSGDGAAWTLEKPNTFLDQSFDSGRDWEGRHTAGYVVLRDKMWIIGGDANQGHYQNDVWCSEDGKAWTCVDKNVPWGPRVLHYTVQFQDKMWIMGGQTLCQFAPFEERFYDDIWNSPDGVRWEKLTPRAPWWSPRGMIGGAIVFKDRIWLLGGGTYDTPKVPTRKFFNDVWSTPDGVTWDRHVPFAPWEPRQYHDVAVYDGRMWVMEGWNQKNRNDVWYSADGVNWYELPNTPWNPRHAASAFVYGGALWMVAGNNMEKDVWKLQRARP